MSNYKKGLTVSEGVSIGYVYKYEGNDFEDILESKNISKKSIEIEKEKFLTARDSHIIHLRDSLCENKDQEDILSTQVLMMEDPFFEDLVIAEIENEKKTSVHALDSACNQIIKEIESIEDDYLSQRRDDYLDIKNQLIKIILGKENSDLSALPKDTILVAKDLLPSDTINFDFENVNGILTDRGGIYTHTSLLAQSFSINAIVAMGDIYDSVNHGDKIIIDAYKSIAIVNPTEEELDKYSSLYQEELERDLSYRKNLSAKGKTSDNKEIGIMANVGSLREIDHAIENGCDGIGLFRTEFIYMDRDEFPSEDYQFEIYKEAAKKLKGKKLVIRTLDVGGDKSLPYFDVQMRGNSYLGWRGIRITLDVKEIFNTQLRAILRASAYGNISILLPMVISVEELDDFYQLLDLAKTELRKSEKNFDENIEVGIMIETPSNIVLADEFARRVDYFSIGTNDLTQYLLAVDRSNSRVANLYSNYHPAVLRSIKKVVDIAHENGITCSMCGGMASEYKANKLLLGIELDNISVVSGRIPRLKAMVSNLNYKESVAYAGDILKLARAHEIEEVLNKDYENIPK